jgi:hypothetical protein
VDKWLRIRPAVFWVTNGNHLSNPNGNDTGGNDTGSNDRPGNDTGGNDTGGNDSGGYGVLSSGGYGVPGRAPKFMTRGSSAAPTVGGREF